MGDDILHRCVIMGDSRRVNQRGRVISAALKSPELNKAGSGECFVYMEESMFHKIIAKN